MTRTRTRQLPRWGDACPTPPGATDDGCVVTGRLSRLNGGAETVLIEDLCQQYPSHSVGTLAFGADGRCTSAAATARRSTSRTTGRTAPRSTRAATRRRGRGAAPGGGRRLRSQDVRTRPTRRASTARSCVHPDTGAARRQPERRRADPNARRIVAYGLRNPFRIPVRPGTGEVWSGDVGWNRGRRSTAPRPPRRKSATTAGRATRATGQGSYDTLNLTDLRDPLQRRAPRHRRRTTPTTTVAGRAGEACGGGSSSISDSPSRRRTAASRRLQGRAVLRRLLAMHLGHVRPAPTGCPTPTTARPSWPAPRTRWCSSRAGRRALLRRPRRAARSAGSARRPTPRRPRARRRPARPARAP